jgi:hypothetical protein
MRRDAREQTREGRGREQELSFLMKKEGRAGPFGFMVFWRYNGPVAVQSLEFHTLLITKGMANDNVSIVKGGIITAELGDTVVCGQFGFGQR